MNFLQICILEKDPELRTLAKVLHTDLLGMGNSLLIVERSAATAGPKIGMFQFGHTLPLGNGYPRKLY